MTSRGWFARYRQGRRDEVWQEFRQLGDRVREPASLPEVVAVCDEMALRARRNVESLVSSLSERGYRFTTNDNQHSDVPAHVPPTSSADDTARWLDQRFSVSLAVMSWLRLVGDVWMVGSHPDWPAAAEADPLVIELEGSRYPNADIGSYFEDDHAQWQQGREDHPDESQLYVLPVAPDRLHKANVSGGAPYGFLVPDRGAEGIFRADVDMPFVSYLNLVFRNGGFAHPTGQNAEQRAFAQRASAAMLPL